MAVDKYALIARVKELEGLTNDDKSQIIGFIKTKTYGLVWEDSTEKCWEQLKEYIPVLIENKERAIISDRPEAPNHILIEGDNLLALTNLCATHQGKIDVIYIDPPYNTGNKDFVYNDSYVDSEDAFRHSKWLSFMSKRLRIAKRLLSDRGVIFISIDDNEQAQLKILCDEIFGENDFVAKFDWRKKTGANDAKDVAIVTETVLLYAKNHFVTIENKIWKRDEDSINRDRYRFEDEFVETRGKFYYDTLDRGGLQYSDSMNFGIEAPDGGIIFPHGRDSFVNDGWIWKWGREKVEWGIKHKFLEFVKSNKSKGSSYTIKYKVYQFVDNEGNIRERSGRAFMNLILDPINQIGNSEMKEIFENKTPFSNPKPIGLIKYLLRTIQNQDSTILDFFAGSGTTMHAVMQLNKEDGGHRQCILVTNNENSICENVTYERNKRVINGYTKPNGEWVEGLHDNNLRYYKVGFVPRDKDLRFVTSFAISSVNTLCIKHGVYAEQPQFGSLQCEAKRLRYFDDGVRRFLVILDPELVGDIIAQLQQAEYDGRMPVYVFTTGNYPYTDDFGQVSDRVELYPYPTCIYGACEQEMPRTVDKPLDMPDDIELTDDEANMTYDDLNKE